MQEKEEFIEKIVSLNLQGLNNNQIGKLLNIERSTACYYLKKRGLKSNLLKPTEKYKHIDFEKEIPHYNKLGYSDLKIANILNCSEKTIQTRRFKMGINNNISSTIEICKKMEEIIVGTILGDGYIYANKISGQLVFAHCLKQKDYCFYKYNLLKSLYKREPRYNEQIRNGKINISYYAHTRSFISLKKYRDIFYEGKIKIIPKNIEEYFTDLSLAILYMDDGYFHKNAYNIALCNFSLDSLIIFQEFLKNKWNIDSSIMKNHVVYIKANSTVIFQNLINPYITECMKYKIKNPL